VIRIKPLSIAIAGAACVTIGSATITPVQASGLRFNSQLSPNEYQYQLFASFADEPSIAGEFFTLSGLSGVTGASVLSNDSNISPFLSDLLDVSFTPTSATWTWRDTLADPNSGLIGKFDSADVNGVSLSQFDFRVFSTSSTLGAVSSVGTNSFAVTTQGAVAIPEPALLPGLISLGLGVLRKRRAEATEQLVES